MALIRRGIVLNVPYAEKDDAKALGAKWDPDMRKWFVPAGQDCRPFKKWFEAKSADGTQSERGAAQDMKVPQQNEEALSLE